LDWLSRIVEEKIQEAIEKGEFNNVQGMSKPLKLDDDSMVPEDLRATYRLMKNAGVLPEELQLRKDMITLQDLIKCCDDEREQEKLQRELSALRLRYQTLMAQRGWSASAVFREYEEKIENKLAGHEEK